MRQTDKPRFLVLGNFLSVHGLNRSVCEDMADRLESRGYGILRSSSRRGKYARLLDRIYTAIRRTHEYDVGYADVFGGPAFVWVEAACWALRRAHRPYILTLHGGNLPRFAERWPGRVRCLLASAHAVTVPSKYLLEQMRSYRKGLILLPNAIDLNCYAFKPRSQPTARLVWLRAFGAGYNPSMAPRVTAILRREFGEIRLVMFGPDKGDGSLQRCRAVAAELGVLDCIEFPGSIPKSQVPASLQQNDIFINTTNVDNAPVSVTEAMACGLCIVSTKVGGIPYLLNNEQDSLLVRPNDPEAMAAAVRRLLIEPGLADRVSKNARRKAELFDWSNVLPLWETIIAEAATRRQYGRD